MGHPGGEVPIALIHHHLKFYPGGLEALEHESTGSIGLRRVGRCRHPFPPGPAARSRLALPRNCIPSTISPVIAYCESQTNAAAGFIIAADVLYRQVEDVSLDSPCALMALRRC